jgi:Zn finger protein HypA/HybF involved in hydrogenase expression
MSGLVFPRRLRVHCPRCGHAEQENAFAPEHMTERLCPDCRKGTLEVVDKGEGIWDPRPSDTA